MTHQPYEDWLFLDEPLTAEQAEELHWHLENCQSCQNLSQAWQEVEAQLEFAPLSEPEPGFASRWQARLEKDGQRLHRRQSLALLGFAVLGAGLLSASLVILAAPGLEAPGVLAWTWLYRLVSVLSVAASTRGIIIDLFTNLAGWISPLGWVLIVGILTQVAVLWVVALRVLTRARSMSS